VKNVSPSALLLIIRHRRLLLRLADTDGIVKLNPNHSIVIKFSFRTIPRRKAGLDCVLSLVPRS
jgi:hypothetical protein